jgi:hypothetical protein
MQQSTVVLQLESRLVGSCPPEPGYMQLVP